MVGWLIDGDGDIIDEVDVDVNGVLLPDDRLIKIIGLINVLSGLVNDDSS